jgi:formyltetrahydrofolate deformylase
LLLRHSAHELDHHTADIHTVVSNHDTLRNVAETFGIPYHYAPLHAGMTLEEKQETERQQLELLKDVDVVVLARYMQVLSSDFLKQFPPDGIINIHHSFLPAFVGGSPYHQAHDRGVKLIGATAHYATSDLDNGPIIDQDVIAVSHRDNVKQLIQKGRILERNVLFRALEAHLDDRTIIHGNRTIVFGD